VAQIALPQQIKTNIFRLIGYISRLLGKLLQSIGIKIAAYWAKAERGSTTLPLKNDLKAF
jgi:hypothetical protein